MFLTHILLMDEHFLSHLGCTESIALFHRQKHNRSESAASYPGASLWIGPFCRFILISSLRAYHPFVLFVFVVILALHGISQTGRKGGEANAITEGKGI